MRNSIRVVGVIASMLVISACAATSPNAKPQTASATQDPTCLKQTGGRVPGRDADCAGYGRTYSKDDINRTGAETPGQALGLLDPSVTVTH